MRIEIGPKDIEKNQVVLVRRDNKEKAFVPLKDAVKKSKSILKSVHKFLQKRADKLLKDNISHPKDYEELKTIQKTKRGFCRANWCGSEVCGEQVKDETGADIRGTREDLKEEVYGPCIICGKEAKEVVYIAPAY